MKIKKNILGVVGSGGGGVGGGLGGGQGRCNRDLKLM